MTTKHAPATPLPWYAATRHIGSLAIPTSALFADVRQTANHDVAVQDATYIARAANAYPQLVEDNARLLAALQLMVREILPLAHGRRFTAPRRDAVEQARSAIAGTCAILRSLGEDA